MANNFKKSRPQKIATTNTKSSTNQHAWQMKTNQPNIKNEQSMDEFLDSKKLWRKPVAKDGSCLFRVVAEEVYNSQSVHLDVRRECLDYMKNNSDMFSAFIEEPFDHYLYKMRNPKEWAGEVELTAMSKLYNVDFLVYQVVNGEPMHLRNDVGSKVIRLCYLNGNHYDAIYPKQYKEAATFIQGIIDELIDNSISICEVNGLHKESSTIKRINSNEYRNVELEVYDESKKEQQSTDEKLATKLQLQVNDECSVLLRDLKENDSLYHKAIIKTVVSEGELYEVYIDELNENHHVPFDDIDLPLDTTYRELSGYYRKTDTQDGSYKTQANRKKKNNRGRNSTGKGGRLDQTADVRRESRSNNPTDRNGPRNRKSEQKRSQPMANGHVPIKAEAEITVPEKQLDSESNVNEEKRLSTNNVNDATLPVTIARGPEKEENESSSAFWGKLKFVTPKPPVPTREDNKNLISSPIPKSDSQLGSDSATIDGTKKANKNIQEPTPNLIQELVEDNCINGLDIGSVVRKPEEELTLMHIPAASVITPNTPTAPLFDHNIELNTDNDLTFVHNDIEEDANQFATQATPSRIDDVKSLQSECPDIVSMEEEPSQGITSSKVHRKNKKKIRILKKDQDQLDSTNDENYENEIVLSPNLGDSFEKREKKVSFAVDVTEITEPVNINNEIAIDSMPDLVNGIDHDETETAAENDSIPSHVKPISNDTTQATPSLIPIVSPTQLQPGVFLPNVGHVPYSVDPEGKDLPSDTRLTQYLFNVGIQHCIMQQQQQLQQQHPHIQHIRLQNQYVNAIPVSAVQTISHANFGYNTTDEMSRGYQTGTIYAGQTMSNVYEYQQQQQQQQYMMQQHLPQDNYQQHWKQQQHRQQLSNDYRNTKEFHHRNAKKLYGKTN